MLLAKLSDRLTLSTVSSVGQTPALEIRRATTSISAAGTRCSANTPTAQPELSRPYLPNNAPSSQSHRRRSERPLWRSGRSKQVHSLPGFLSRPPTLFLVPAEHSALHTAHHNIRFNSPHHAGLGFHSEVRRRKPKAVFRAVFFRVETFRRPLRPAWGQVGSCTRPLADSSVNISRPAMRDLG
jgi:hypothetical protein